MAFGDYQESQSHSYNGQLTFPANHSVQLHGNPASNHDIIIVVVSHGNMVPTELNNRFTLTNIHNGLVYLALDVPPGDFTIRVAFSGAMNSPAMAYHRFTGSATAYYDDIDSRVTYSEGFGAYGARSWTHSPKGLLVEIVGENEDHGGILGSPVTRIPPTADSHMGGPLRYNWGTWNVSTRWVQAFQMWSRTYDDYIRPHGEYSIWSATGPSVEGHMFPVCISEAAADPIPDPVPASVIRVVRRAARTGTSGVSASPYMLPYTATPAGNELVVLLTWVGNPGVVTPPGGWTETLPPTADGNDHYYAVYRKTACRQLDRPQLVSTSRHLSQGGVDLLAIDWKSNVLAGRSRVIVGDRYEVAIRVPAGFKLKSAKAAGESAKVVAEGELVRLIWTPVVTGEVDWKFVF